MKLADWLNQKVVETGWSLREIGRRAGITGASLARYATGDMIPTPESCRKLAAALGVPYQEVMRLAGHLPPESGDGHADISKPQLQALNAVREAEGKEPIIYLPAALEQDIEEFLQDFPQLRQITEEAKARNLSPQAIRAIMYNVRIFVERREERMPFSEVHRRLSDVFAQLAT